jgi:hypothetical protein
MKKLLFLILTNLLMSTIAKGQMENEKDSICNFLVRGLWIQYEIEKNWNPNNDTTILYSSEAEEIYYKKQLATIGDNTEDSIYLSIPRYAEETAIIFERKTKLEREFAPNSHYGRVLSKNLIEQWTKYYLKNRRKFRIGELQKILNESL